MSNEPNDTDQQLPDEDISRNFDAGGNRKSRKKTKNIIWTVIIIIIMLCVMGGIVIFGIYSLNSSKSDQTGPAPSKDPALTQHSDDDTVSAYQAQLKARKAQEERERIERERREDEARNRRDNQKQQDPFATASQSTHSDPGQDNKNRPMTPEERRLTPGIMVDASSLSVGASGSDNGAVNRQQASSADSNDGLDNLRAAARGEGAAANPDLAANGSNGASGQAAGSGQTYIESHMKTSQFAPGSAYKMPNRDFLLARGSNLRCTTKEEIISEYPAPLDCTITKDIYSDNGKNLIIRAGDVLSGEMNVQLTQGKSKLFSAFTLLRGQRGLDSGIQADLASMAVGPMGSGGIDAYVDNHWGARFGNSIMLAFIQDIFSSASSATQKNNSQYTVNNTENNASDMANKALENSIDIPPTGYVLPAKTINVYIMRDIDFSSVYEVKKIHSTTNINWDDCNCNK